MMMSNPDAQFLKDAELQDLLGRWSVPDPPWSLDNRVSAAYNLMMADAAMRPDPTLHPQHGSEVATMKVCSTCQEQFADRFSFCPVDGSPLTLVPQKTLARPTAPDIE